MIKPITILLFLLNYFTFSNYLHAQKKFEVTLIIQNLKVDDLNIMVDDGYEQKNIIPDFQDTSMLISGEYVSKYASLSIAYSNPKSKFPFHQTFFISSTPAEIRLSNAEDIFQNVKTKNIITFTEQETAYKNFYRPAETELFQYHDKNIDQLGRNDSITAVLFAKADAIIGIKTQYVQQSKGSYFDLWVFRNEVAYNNMIPMDSLLGIYQSTFSDKWKDSYEEKKIMRIVKGRNIHKGQQAFDFGAIDINDIRHELADYRGKFVLINFWASWCAPCIEKLPALNKVKQQFANDLVILFFTLDNDQEKFYKAVEKYGIKGDLHFFASKDIIETYGAQTVPKLYLVSPHGSIAYTLSDETGHNLEVLQSILQEKTGSYRALSEE